MFYNDCVESPNEKSLVFALTGNIDCFYVNLLHHANYGMLILLVLQVFTCCSVYVNLSH